MTGNTTHPAQKFLFNRSFDTVTETAAAKQPPAITQAELDAAREAGYRAGHAAAEQALAQSQQSQLVLAAAQLERQVEKLLQQSLQQQAEAQAEMTDITLTIARKLLPAIVAEHALTGIKDMLAQVCKDMTREPRLVVRVQDSLLDPLKQQLDALTRQAAYAGKIVLLADDTLLPGDCKIEWADGGIERDSATIWQQIEQAVRHARDLGAANSSSTNPQE